MSEHTAEVCSIERSRIYKRRERNHHSENIWLSSEELHRRGILGKRRVVSVEIGGAAPFKYSASGMPKTPSVAPVSALVSTARRSATG